MSKKYMTPPHKQGVGNANSPFYKLWENGAEFLLAIVFFFVACLSSASTIRGMSMGMLVVLLAVGVICRQNLRDRISLPMVFMTLFVVMCGVSTFHAVSGKFALKEFLKVLFSYCLALVLVATSPKDKATGGRWLATILSGATALISLVSIDLLSTHIITTPVISFLNLFSTDYANLGIVESGIRMLSLIEKPNVYAGVAGIGVLLGLGLATTENKAWYKRAHLACLFVNALGFLLAFSMGGSAMIALAFIAYLFLEVKERRGPLLILMVETLVLTLLAVVPISMTSLDAWTGFQPIPLVCTVIGAVLLCVLDGTVGHKVAEKLRNKGNLVLGLIAGLLLFVIAFAFAAYNLTGSTTLQRGETLRRSVYPASGSYTVSAQFNGSVNVTIRSQNEQETMMHTHTVLYRGDLSQASFTVPEDSRVVYFNFSAKEDVTLDEVILQGANGEVEVPLGYRLLPNFIANRLQGLFANQNAIQRVVFFEDGLKLFQRSPVFGLGMGAYENGIQSVQSFHYETKYAHNHYIQVLVEIGVVGLVLFVGMLLCLAYALWRAGKQESPHFLLPSLGATLIFMAGHAAVEVDFSFYAYLPFAFGVFALISICAGDSVSISWLSKKTRNALMAGTAVLLAVFGFFLGRNMQAQAMTSTGRVTSVDLIAAAKIDRFEWPDYALSYVANMPDDPSESILLQANEFAEDLAELDSNSIPRYLLKFYLKTNQIDNAFAMAEKYVDYVAADPDTWQDTFDLLMLYAQNTEEYRTGVNRIADKLEQWNSQNMGSIELDESAKAFLEIMGG